MAFDPVTAAQAAAQAKDRRGSRVAQFDILRDLPGTLVHYHDADSLSSLSDGAAVKRWPDRGPNRLDFEQRTSANQPTKQTQGGKTVVRFASGHRLDCNAFGSTWPFPAGGSQPLYRVTVARSLSTNSAYALIAGGNNASNGSKLLLDQVTGAPYTFAGSGVTLGPDARDNAAHVIVEVQRTDSMAVYLDGRLISSSSTQAHGTQGLKELRFGNLDVGANQWLGDLYMSATFLGSIGPEEISALTASVGAAKGIAVASCDVATPWETATVGSQACRIFNPAANVAPTVAIIWGHPHSQNEQLSAGYWGFPYAHLAVQRGWVFAASNLAGDNWGNATAQTAHVALASQIKSTYPTVTKIIHVGASMGGLVGLNVARDGSIAELAGVYLIDGCCDLANMHANATYTSSVRTAYGVAGDGSDYSSKTSGFDPMLASASAFPAIRYRFLASTSDTAVPKTSHADAMSSKLSTRGLEYAVKAHLGGHLAGGAVDPADFEAFVNRCIA